MRRGTRAASRRRAIGLVAGLGALCVYGLLTYPHPAAWLGLGGLAVLALGRWRFAGGPLPGSPFAVPFALYLAGALVGLWVTTSPYYGAVRLFGLLAAFGAFCLVLDLVRSPATANRTVAVALVVLAVVVPLLLILLPPYLRLARFPYPDLPAGYQALRDAVWGMDAASQRYRLAPSGVGALAVFGLGLALGPLLAGGSRRTRLLGGLAAGYFFVLLIANNSRGAVLSALLVGLLIVVIQRPRLLLGAPLVLGVLAVGWAHREALPLPPWATDVASDLRHDGLASPQSLYQRFELWGDALFLLADFRFTGVGLGLPAPRRVSAEYFRSVVIPFDHGHNIFVQSYLEQGLLGLLGLLGLVAAALAVAIRTIPAAAPQPVRLAAISATGAAFGLLFAGLSDVDAITTIGMVMLAAPLGLLAACGRSGRAGERESGTAGEEPTEVGARPVGHRPRAAARGMRRLLPLSLASLVLLILLLALVGPARLGAEVDLNLGSVELARATAALGDAEQERQHAAAAAFYLGRAAEREPGDPRVLRGLAAALAGTDREGARRALERAAEVTAPDDSRSFFQIGRLYREIREVDAALAAWEHVDPSLNVWNGAGLDYQLVSWGTSLALVGRWRDAIAVNQAAIRAAPTNPAPWATLGVALARELGPRGALPTLESLVESYPDVPWAYREVQSARRRAGQWQEDALWRGRVAAASGSAAWARRQADAASARQYHLRWRGHIPSGRSSRPPKTPTIDDGMSQDGGARLITNTTDRLRSYVTEVEFKRGETVVAAARGTAEHVRPGERRAIRFSPPPPSLESSGIVAVFRTVTEESEAGQLAEAATRLRLAGWRDLSDVGLEVVVRNDDRAAHSFVVQAMLGEDGRFLRLLSGTVAELGPGQQAAVTLLAPRRLPSYNQVLLGIERILD